MKRLLSVFALSAVLAVSLSFAALAQEGHDMGMKQGEEGMKKDAPKTMTVTGEIVDMGCYLGHGAKGEGHKECALKCIANGMPMGLLTSDGTLYLLTMSHSDADPFNNAKKMAADMVEITGPVSERNGVKSIEVDKVAEAKADKGE
jgi:hypothetical protein